MALEHKLIARNTTPWGGLLLGMFQFEEEKEEKDPP